MERMLGVDYGRARIGLAANDPLGIAAHPVAALEGPPERAIPRIQAVCAEREIERIVLGLPLNMDGSEGPMAAEVRAFGARLGQATGLPVAYADERLTSFEAEEQLKGIRRRRRDRGRVDAVAAARILEGYMRRG